MSQDYKAGFEAGMAHAQNLMFTRLLHDTGKRAVIKALFRKAHEDQRPQNGTIKNDQLEAYSEGFRHCLNILDGLGDGIETYKHVLNPAIRIDLTVEDVMRLS